jgi:hypothetical protein
MKIDDVKFKCVIPDVETQNSILSAMKHPTFKDKYLFLIKDKYETRGTSNADFFISRDLPYMEPGEVIKMLAACDENQPKPTDGEWVEFEISDRHMTRMPSFTIPIADINHTYCWVDYLGAECDSGLIFGGWWFEEYKSWTTARIGIENQKASLFIADWERPSTPTKIRFWRPRSEGRLR